MARQSIMDDSGWVEVMYINGYAVFMGYLMMGVRGLGVLVLTWTTVVLLGGFVSELGKKDFWCLTEITLVQTAGVFNVILEQTISDFVRSWWGLLGTAAATVIKPFRKGKESKKVSTKRIVLAFFLSGIQALVLVIILCPVAILYVFGIYISAGVGMWRLIEHDFSNADGAANLKPALQVLYSLVVAQGLIYVYKIIHAFGAKFELAEFVAGVLESVDKDLVSSYLEDTVAGCEKDPSFATGRNLVTYAVDLMMDDAKSIDRYINGVKILGAAIGKEDTTFDHHDRMELAKHLLTRPSYSFSQMIQRLLETLGPSSPYSGKIRGQAAVIVAIVASSIHLEEHPEWIQCISSLLETFEEYCWRPEEYDFYRSRLPKEYERGWLLEKYEEHPLFRYGRQKSTVDNNLFRDGYRRLVRQGFEILQKLAVRQDNCRVIINTDGLLLKITAHLNYKQMREETVKWATIAVESLKLLMQLAANPGETGTKVQGEISRRSKAIITTLESILESLECNVVLKISTVDIVLHLSVDTSSMNTSGRCGRIFNWILLLIFLLPDEEVRRFKTRMKISSDTRRLAGEKKISSNQELPLQQSVGFVLRDLTTALVGAGDISTRVHAAKILKHLCHRYREDYEYFEELKKVMVAVMPEVLKEILGRGSTGEAVTKAANNFQSSSQDIDDLEIGGVSGGEGCEQTSSSQQQIGDETEDIKLRKELTSLCETIYFWRYRGCINVTQLDEIAERVCSERRKPVKTFKELLKEGREILEKAAAKEG